MLPFFTEYFGNPMSVHSFGRDSKKYLEAARETIAECLGAEPREILFTASGTEADNWAIRELLKPTPRRASTLLPLRSNTMRFCTLQRSWRKRATRLLTYL